MRIQAPKQETPHFHAWLLVLFLWQIFFTLPNAVCAQTSDPAFAWISLTHREKISEARYRELFLLKAAKIAQSRGFTHFELVDQNGYESHGTVTSDKFYTTDAYGNVSYSAWLARTHASPISKENGALVHFCNQGDEVCRGLYAHKVILNLAQ